jgi:uncharacterized protein (DUF433 family)
MSAIIDQGVELIVATDPLYGVVWVNPARMSGEPCFYGTRVPVKNLFDYLAGGDSLEVFLDAFEGVQREQATAVLNLAGEEFLERLRPR